MTIITPKQSAIDLDISWKAKSSNTYPVDLNVLVRDVVNLESGNDLLHLEEAEFSNGILGLLTRKENTRNWVAIVQKKIPYLGRKRFTKAHEIYHFIGHRNLQSKFECNNKDLSLSLAGEDVEREANAFAAELLIPASIIRQHLSSEFCYENALAIAFMLSASVEPVSNRWVKMSAKPLIFVKSRDGHVLYTYKNSHSWDYADNIYEGMEISNESISFASRENSKDMSGERDGSVWGIKNRSIFEDAFFGKDGFMYSYITIHE